MASFVCRKFLKLPASALWVGRISTTRHLCRTGSPLVARSVPGLRMHSSTMPGGGGQPGGRNWKNFAWKAFVGAMSITGVLVWTTELLDAFSQSLSPEEYNEALAPYLDEERRKDAFYGLESSLPDDLYYRELDAKNKALMELTNMLGKTTAGKELIGKRGPLTFHCIWSRYQEWGEEFRDVGSNGQDGSNAREQSRTWNVKFYVEGSKGIALALAKFQENNHGEWICVHVHVEKMERSGEAMLKAKSALPHGIRYMNLNARISKD